MRGSYLPQTDEASGFPAVLHSRWRLGLVGHHQHGSAGTQVCDTRATPNVLGINDVLLRNITPNSEHGDSFL